MKKQLLSFLTFLVVINCPGQDNPAKKSLSLSLGLSSITRQDLIFSPFIHSDVSVLNVGLDYTRQAKLFQKVSLRYGNFNPMVAEPYEFTVHGEPQTAYPHSFNLVDLDYLFGKKISASDKTAFYAGGMFFMDVQALNYIYGRISSFGYYSMTGIGLFGRYNYKFNENDQLITTLKLPFAGWQARSPYLVNDDEFIENISSHSGMKTFVSLLGDGEAVSWRSWQSLDLDVKYMHRMNDKWQIGLAYLFDLVHANQPVNLLSYRHSVNFSLNFNF